jgi:D-glucuronyl C5-epimerase C-terminus
MRAAVPFVLLVLLAICAGGCGATEPAPALPRHEVRQPERDDVLKAATWRSAAAAEAAREARRQAAIRRARRSRTVHGALRLARLTRHLSPRGRRRYARDYEAARRAARRLTGARAAELATVVGVVDRLAAERRLTASRLRPAFLVLRRNTQFWTRAPMPPAGHRTTFGRDPAVFQYYPGRGIQLQPLASWGRANWMAGACVRSPRRCPAHKLRRTLDALLALGSSRGGFLAWEHFFDWGGGTAPWISGMSQATAISALARGSDALHRRRYRRAARRALGAFRTPPPAGVAAGDHYLMYSFAPSLRIFNGELQAVSGIGELAALGDRGARRLFRRGERAVRRTVEAFDTGAWSLYSQAGRESTLDYHRLVGRFLGDMCERIGRRAYCSVHRRFARYEREPTRIGVAPLERLVAGRTTLVRFSLSKVSSVKVRVWGTRGLSLSDDLELPRGAHQLAWTPPARGRFRLRIEAQGPSGPLGVADRSIRIVLPKPKPKRCRKKGKKRCLRSETNRSH